MRLTSDRGCVASVAMWMAAILCAAATPAAAQNDRWGAGYFPNVTLTTHHGTKVHFYDDLIKGRIVAINLIYTTCTYACPLETARLAQVQRLIGDRMGRDVFFYSITIDPEHDSPAVLADYAAKFNAGPGWLFLTGRREDIDLISRKIGLYSPPNPSNPDGHTPHLLVGNEVTGQWMRNSGVDDPKFLATTISTWLNSWRTAPKPTQSYADAPNLSFAPGEYTFTRHCAACHTIGGGDRIGPDLAGVTATRDRAWLMRFITAPDAMRAAGDATARSLAGRYRPAVMPALGLGADDVAQVLDYIAKQTPPPREAAAPGGTAPAGTPGDLAPLLESYVQLQRALNTGSSAAIAAGVRAVAAAAPPAGDGAAAVRAAAAGMVYLGDAAATRALFERLSDALIAFGSHTNALGADVKVAYCPMLRKHWLQRPGTIQNPYYGPQMPDCGRFVDTLGAPRDSTSAAPPRTPPLDQPGERRAP